LASCDGNKLREGLFVLDIERSTLGVKLLRGAVNRDKCFIDEVAIKRAVRVVELMYLLLQLRDPQSEFLLLRSYMGIAKKKFGLRTCQPIHMEETTILFDKGLRSAVENIMVSGGPFFGDLQWRTTNSISIKVGGLRLYSAVETTLYAFVASRSQS
jgi:hypothetical protein